MNIGTTEQVVANLTQWWEAVLRFPLTGSFVITALVIVTASLAGRFGVRDE